MTPGIHAKDKHTYKIFYTFAIIFSGQLFLVFWASIPVKPECPSGIFLSNIRCTLGVSHWAPCVLPESCLPVLDLEIVWFLYLLQQPSSRNAQRSVPHFCSGQYLCACHCGQEIEMDLSTITLMPFDSVLEECAFWTLSNACNER